MNPYQHRVPHNTHNIWYCAIWGKLITSSVPVVPDIVTTPIVICCTCIWIRELNSLMCSI